MRKWLWVLVLVGGAGAQEEFGEAVKLASSRPRYVVRRGYALPAGVTAAEKPEARKGRLDKDDYFFFDVDGNGKWNDLGVDGWALNRMPYMLPLEDGTVIGASRFFWRMEEDGSALRFRREPLPLSPEAKKVLIEFNTWRMMNGLPAVTIDERLSAACAAHCAYMERNGMTHEEEQGKEGFSPEGAEAGKRSGRGEDGPINAVRMFYASFYHRLPLADPGTKAIGVGASERYAAVDGISLRDRRAWEWPVIIPAPNSFGHPTFFSPEAPNPLPEGLQWGGFPITLTFDGGAITEARAELRLKSAKGKTVDVVVSSPERPANERRPDNRKTICVIPRVPLAPMKDWWVKVSWKRDGKDESREWMFRTGRAGPGPVVAAWRMTR